MMWGEVWRRITRPVRAVWRGLLRLTHGVNVVDWIVAAFAFPQHDWAKRLRQTLADDEIEVTWRQAINPLYWIAWTWRFALQWSGSRPYSALAPSIPAGIVLICLIATAAVIARRKPTETQTIYLSTLRTAMASGDMEIASVAAGRLLAMDPDNLEHQYQRAMLDASLGRLDSARTEIFRLAVHKEYGPAALWMLRNLIYENSGQGDIDTGDAALVRRTEWGKEERIVIHRCASVAMNKLPEKRALLAKRMYARFLATIGLPGDALRIFETIAASDPGVSLYAAQLADQQQDDATARRFAAAAIRYLQPEFLSNPTDESLRLELAQAFVLDHQEDQAYRLLIDGLKLSPESVIFRSACGEVLVFKAERLRRRNTGNDALVARAELLTEALKWAPQSPIVVEAVIQLAIDCGEADSAELRQVRRALLQGVSPEAMHFVEGTVLLLKGETDAAREHLELAADTGSNMAGLFNNLAVALSQSDEAELDKALRFSNEALRQLPDHPALLETRGQILLKLGRWRDAIKDLERALASPELQPIVHAALAKAYRELGMDELARQNAARAEMLRSNGSRSNGPPGSGSVPAN